MMMRVSLKPTVLWIWKVIAAFPAGVILLLDWMVSVAERIIVLCVGGAAFYLGYRFVFGKASLSDSSLVSNLSQHWQILALLAIPLFYQTVRKFLEQAEEAWGIKKKRELEGGDTEQKPNPSKKT
jgi:1,4-dihydroxy-2-naphthoate octaprenyltransferase